MSELFDINSLNLDEVKNYVKVAKTGDLKSEFPFSRIKFTQNKRVRFSLISSEVITLKRHYTDELGYFICTNGKCCSVAKKQAATVYLYPAVLYTQCDDRGKLNGNEIEVRLLIANKDMYNTIVGIQEIKGEITQFDFLGAQDASGKFPKTTLLEAGFATWKDSQANVDYVKNYLKENGKYFLDAVGKRISDEKFDEIMSSQSDDIPQPQTIQPTSDAELNQIFKVNL